MEKTFGIIKPHVLKKENNLEKAKIALSKILSHVNGLKITYSKVIQITREEAMELYKEHKEKFFFPQMLNIMAKNDLVLMILEGENIIEEYRKALGATNPLESAEGTLRNQFGESLDYNGFHGSDKQESAKRELNIFSQKILDNLEK